jgi:hypothetical protein
MMMIKEIFALGRALLPAFPTLASQNSSLQAANFSSNTTV